MGQKRDLLGIIEAAYVLDGDDADWLTGLAASVVANVPFRVQGVTVNAYDISDPERPQLSEGFSCAAPDTARLLHNWGELVKHFETEPALTRVGYGALDEGLARDIPVPGRERLDAVLRRLEMGDVYGVNARNPSGKGVLVGVCLPPRFAPIRANTRRAFARIARHIAAAYRLRRRLAEGRSSADSLARADAVLGTNGTVEHAAGDARSDRVVEALRRAVVDVASARGHIRHEDPSRAIATWRALVDARWSLVDHFERDGSQYVVAHRNDCQTSPIARLTLREQQVVALAAMGYSNKAIAYDLGIATSTVGVLVSRALKRLGLRSRRELANLYPQAPRPGHGTPSS